MRIHIPEIAQVGAETSVSARVDFATPVAAYPGKLEYRFPNRFAVYTSGRADPFLAALLPLAMSLGEPLEVYGHVSPKLAYGLGEYQRLFSVWYPSRLKIVSVDSKEFLPSQRTGQEGVALSFSGGVDSFYSLHRHLPAHQTIPAAALTHGFFIYGFDTPLADPSAYVQMAEGYSRLFDQLDLELIPVHTNIRFFTERHLPFTISHGAVLASAGLLFDRFFHRQYIAPSYRYSHLRPWGSSPVSDHLFSTESLDVVHDSARGSRLDRITAISAWEPARQHLRVCANPRRAVGQKNCSRCDKCLRTIFMLDILGVLDSFPTLSNRASRLSILRWGLLYDFSGGFHRLFIQQAKLHHRPELVPWFYFASILGWLHMYADRFSPRQLLHRLGRPLQTKRPNPFITN